MERFEPSTLAGLVFETSAYTVPPHRPVEPFHEMPTVLSSRRNCQSKRGRHETDCVTGAIVAYCQTAVKRELRSFATYSCTSLSHTTSMPCDHSQSDRATYLLSAFVIAR